MIRARPWLGLALFVALASGAHVACSSDEAPPAGDVTTKLEVNVQLTGGTNLRAVVEELERRSRRATIWLTAAEIDAQCAYVQSLSAKGHEIAGVFPEEITPELSLDSQRAIIAALRDATSRCSVAPMVGFRAKKFTANEHTYAALDEAGLRYLERSARAEPYSIYTFKPYALGGRGFAVLPMPVLVSFGRVASLCDNASTDLMSASDLVAYERVAIDFHARTLEPLVLEWHTETAFPGDPGGYFQAYKDVLDHLESKGDAVRFVTAAALVDRHVPSGTGCGLCVQASP